MLSCAFVNLLRQILNIVRARVAKICNFAIAQGPIMKRARELNLCRTFISSISLILQIAGSNLEQTMLNPTQVL